MAPMWRWIAIAAALVACGHAAPPAAPAPGTTHATPDAGPSVDAAPVALDADLPELARRSVALYQELAKALADANSDCSAATTKLDAIATTYADVIEANARVLHAGHERIKQLKAALVPYEADLDAAAQQIVSSPTMRACSQDPGFANVMDRLVGEPP
jgi:hypothetical protein